jgi:hypothetical protein
LFFVTIENTPGLVSVGEQIRNFLNRLTPEQMAAAKPKIRAWAEFVWEKRGRGDSTPEQEKSDWSKGEIIWAAGQSLRL